MKSILNFNFDLPGTLINNGQTENLVFGREMPKSEIETIYTLDNIDIPETAIATWDATQEQNGTITAWILDEDNNGLYELYIGTSTGAISLPANSDWFFSYYNNVKNIDTTHLDTSKVTKISSMFRNCESLIGLDLSNFNTSNVTTMSYMFFKCYNLASLDLSGFDTSKVTNMADMFSGCQSLTSLNLSRFDTYQVTNMQNMFTNCQSLISLDLSNFNTSKVTNMSYMFSSSKAQTLNLSSFDTSNVTDMDSMFSYSKALTLDLNSFNTGNVTNMKIPCAMNARDIAKTEVGTPEDEIVSTLSIEQIDTSRESVRNVLSGFAPQNEAENRIAGMKKGSTFASAFGNDRWLF